MNNALGAVNELAVIAHMTSNALSPLELNDQGNTVFRAAAADEGVSVPRGQTRYAYDKALGDRGWIQYDTRNDASYFGTWVSIESRLVFSYAEGDRTLVACPTVESFRAELDDMAEFWGPAPAAFTVMDSQGVTRYHQ